MMWSVYKIFFLVGFCNADGKVCNRLLESFNITGLRVQLNYTQVKNYIKNGVRCEATYEYHDNEMFELTCMTKISKYNKNYQSMEFWFRELIKSKNLNEIRNEDKKYYINRTIMIQSDDDKKKIECKVKSSDRQGNPREESLVIELLRKLPEPPTPNESNINQNTSNLNRKIIKRDVSHSKDLSRINENSITFQLNFSDSRAKCMDGYITHITEDTGYFLDIIVKSCYEIKYGDCNISRWSDGSIFEMKFNDLLNQAVTKSYEKKCRSNGNLYTAIENIKINESVTLNCSFLTHERSPANITPEVNINGITYVRSLCEKHIDVSSSRKTAIQDNQDITSTPKINENDIQSQSKSTTTLEEDFMTENPLSQKDEPGEEKKKPPFRLENGILYGVGGVCVICVILVFVVYVLKRRVKEDSEPMINSSDGQENRIANQFPPNLETHYARPIDTTYESTYCEPVKEDDLGKVYSQPVPKSQRNQMKKVLNSRAGNKDVSGNSYAKTVPKNQRPQNNPRSEYEDIDCNRNGYTEYSEIAHGTVSPKYSNTFDGSKYVNAKTDSDYAEPTYYAKC